MTPTPQEQPLFNGVTSDLDGDRIVISGMSGLYPESSNIKELSDILYNGVNPIQEKTRWKLKHPEVPPYIGIVPKIDRFDGQFFKVHVQLAHHMDVIGRKILEQAYQAIYDAGVTAERLSGKDIGVFIGVCTSESEKATFFDSTSKSGFNITGNSKTMLANRISYWLNGKGPSMALDASCCSSTAALEQAYLSIKRGDCEAAVVGGTYACLHPQWSMHLGRIMPMSPDGKARSFDEHATGLVRSEAINVLFIQKAKDALRIYGEVAYVKTEFSPLTKGERGPRFGFYRDPLQLSQFLHRFYDEARIPPQCVEYIEAFGSGVPEADKAELDAFDEVFCKNRQKPLMVGSIMSNIGYTEASSGISSITKVLLGFHNRKLAANLHCVNPRQDVKAIREGRLSVVRNNQHFDDTYAAVNSVSINGINGHVLLRGFYKPKDLSQYKCDIPRLVTLSGRFEGAVQTIIDDLKSRPVDPEEIALFHNIHEHRISGHMARGYVLLDTKEGETFSFSEKVNHFDDMKRPLWFVYSGMGSQWAGMGKDLMRLPVFADAIQRCHKALEPKGLDLIHILTSPEKDTYDNILHSFVGITAVQIGLTDVLRSVGLVPDKIIGHSVGELGCAYGDECMTAEETILASYSRGLVSVETEFIRGSMAAVGVGYQEIVKMCPPEIEVACHNGPGSSTISGPAEIMNEFVGKLTAQGIFAKEVPCSNIAYHSRYIAQAGPKLLEKLKEVIPEPRLRSERWLSTSVPQDRWNEEETKYGSAWYHTNNLLNPVLFEEILRLVPSNAVLVEIAPHGLLQAILKRSVSSDCRNIGLTQRGNPNNACFLLEGIGKLYMEGYNVLIKSLYPKVEFPVSTGTPMLSHLVEWSHNDKWKLSTYEHVSKKKASICNFLISLLDDEHSYFRGHVVRGKTVYPFAAALVAVWDTLAMASDVPRKEMSVQFRDMHFFAQPVLHDKRVLKVNVILHKGTGKFEVLDEFSLIATGYITAITNKETPRALTQPMETTKKLELNSQDVYQILQEKDFSFTDDFCSLHKANNSFTDAQVVWNDNWVTLIDGLIQLNILRQQHDTASELSHISRISIDLQIHNESKMTVDGKTVIPAKIDEIYHHARCGGILFEKVQLHDLLPSTEKSFALNTLKFVPRFQTNNVYVVTVFKTYMQIIAENVNKETIKIVGIVDNRDNVFDEIKDIVHNIPGIQVQYEEIASQKLLQNPDIVTIADVIIVKTLSKDENLIKLLDRALKANTFIINTERNEDRKILPATQYKVVSGNTSGSIHLDLGLWKPVPVQFSTNVFVKTPAEVEKLACTRNTLPSQQKLLVISSYPPVPGLKELIKQWRKEPVRNQVYLVMVSGDEKPEKLPDLSLAFSVYEKGVWGGEYFVPCVSNVAVDKEVTLQCERIGELESLKWVEMSEPSGHGIKVTVRYAGINDLDAKRAVGIVPIQQDGTFEGFGMDYSGTTDNGERVMGLVRGGATSGRLSAVPELLWPVPAHWTLEDAVTVPSAYAQAFYCLGIKSQLYPGMTVLVHGGAGALGQAVISIALANDCKVFATVGDVRKKHFLKKLFPDLKDEYIGNSRDDTFGDMVLQATNGNGCDIVISCVKGDLKNTSLKCAAYCGITFDTCQAKSEDNFSYGMFYMTKQRSYVLVDFDTIFDYKEDMEAIQTMMSEGIVRGYVRPLSRIAYSPKDVARAFRLVATSRHRGRVILKMRDSVVPAQPRLTCSEDLSQLLICDKEGFGLQLAKRLITRGAKKLRLHCHKITPIVKQKVEEWKNLGVRVDVSSEDLSFKDGVVSLLMDTLRSGPIEGVYVVVPDTKGDAKASSVISEVIAKLDSASRQSCTSLRYFGVISADDSVGKQTCLDRAQKRLPVTFLHLPLLRDMSLRRSALDAVEKALRGPEPVVLAQPQLISSRASLLSKIAAIADIDISTEGSENKTLKELGLDYVKSKEICLFLENTQNTYVDESEVPNLTVQKIREIEETVAMSDYTDKKGLSIFFSQIDTNELAAGLELQFLKTLNSTPKRADEVDYDSTYLCIVPGMEGNYIRFNSVCSRLKIQAVVLQPGFEHNQETMQEMSERFAKVMLEKLKVKEKGTFYLMGYEGGIPVAVEIAAILEKEGITGTLFLLGGTPNEIYDVITQQLSAFKTDEELQNAVIKHLTSIIAGKEIDGLENILKNCKSWEDKLNETIEALGENISFTMQYVKVVIDNAYMHVKQIQNHKERARELRSKVVVLRASDIKSDKKQPTLSKDTSVFDLDAPLAHSTKDPRCATIINRNLGADILEAYAKKNLCQIYILNPYLFTKRNFLEDE